MNDQPAADFSAEKVTLPDGTPAVIRPIREDRASQLIEGFKKLSPETKRHRFLSAKRGFTPVELYYLTHVDGIKHLALILAITDERGDELEAVAVARCVRNTPEETVAEMAVVVMDHWQRRGIGTLLVKALAQRAWRVGIRHWQAFFLSDNMAIRKLLAATAQPRWEKAVDSQIIEALYDLYPPGET